MQVNDSLHGAMCRKANYDIYTTEGNVDCSVLIYLKQGSHAWFNSAWSWRDRYTSKPPGWTFDRTPEQFIASTDPRVQKHPDEIIVVDAPADSTWSVPIYSYGRGLRWQADRSVAIELMTPDGQVWREEPGEHLKFTYDQARHVKFRSVSDEFVRIIAVRFGN